VTQFGDNNITQYFIQGGQKITMPDSTATGVSGHSLTPDFCKAQLAAFNNRDRFNEVGGFSAMTSALSKPMVLVMSLWDDVGLSPLPIAFSYITHKGG